MRELRRAHVHLAPTSPFYPLPTPSNLNSFFFFFFLSIRPPPTSTLFPYTTLFRSTETNRSALPLWPGLQVVRPGRQAVVVAVDRKSTRLNSSHSSISYAVFCLK